MDKILTKRRVSTIKLRFKGQEKADMKLNKLNINTLIYNTTWNKNYNKKSRYIKQTCFNKTRREMAKSRGSQKNVAVKNSVKSGQDGDAK